MGIKLGGKIRAFMMNRYCSASDTQSCFKKPCADCFQKRIQCANGQAQAFLRWPYYDLRGALLLHVEKQRHQQQLAAGEQTIAAAVVHTSAAAAYTNVAAAPVDSTVAAAEPEELVKIQAVLAVAAVKQLEVTK